MYEFWYDYVKPKYGIQAKLWHMDPDPVYHGYKDCIQISLYTKKQVILTKILQKMLKKDLKLQNYELECNSIKRLFELTDRSYSVSNIQDYFEYIF